jgi:hypothetical protein
MGLSLPFSVNRLKLIGRKEFTIVLPQGLIWKLVYVQPIKRGNTANLGL